MFPDPGPDGKTRGVLGCPTLVFNGNIHDYITRGNKTERKL